MKLRQGLVFAFLCGMLSIVYSANLDSKTTKKRSLIVHAALGVDVFHASDNQIVNSLLALDTSGASEPFGGIAYDAGVSYFPWQYAGFSANYMYLDSQPLDMKVANADMSTNMTQSIILFNLLGRMVLFSHIKLQAGIGVADRSANLSLIHDGDGVFISSQELSWNATALIETELTKHVNIGLQYHFFPKISGFFSSASVEGDQPASDLPATHTLMLRLALTFCQ